MGGGASKITPNHVKTHRITGNHAKTHTQMWSDDIFIFFFIFFIFKFSSLIKDAETFWFSPLFLFLFDLSYGSRAPVVTSEERFFFSRVEQSVTHHSAHIPALSMFVLLSWWWWAHVQRSQFFVVSQVREDAVCFKKDIFAALSASHHSIACQMSW